MILLIFYSLLRIISILVSVMPVASTSKSLKCQWLSRIKVYVLLSSIYIGILVSKKKENVGKTNLRLHCLGNGGTHITLTQIPLMRTGHGRGAEKYWLVG